MASQQWGSAFDSQSVCEMVCGHQVRTNGFSPGTLFPLNSKDHRNIAICASERETFDNLNINQL